jgi:uncharacterized membrane protein YvbJ
MNTKNKKLPIAEKDKLIISFLIASFIFFFIYSLLSNNFLAKTFVLGLEGCRMITMALFDAIFK